MEVRTSSYMATPIMSSATTTGLYRIVLAVDLTGPAAWRGGWWEVGYAPGNGVDLACRTAGQLEQQQQEEEEDREIAYHGVRPPPCRLWQAFASVMRGKAGQRTLLCSSAVVGVDVVAVVAVLVSDFYFWSLTGGILGGVLECVGGSAAGCDGASKVIVGGRVGGPGVEGGDAGVDDGRG